MILNIITPNFNSTANLLSTFDSIHYKICADYDHVGKMIAKNRNFEFSADLISYHMPGGISSDLRQVRKEINTIKLLDFN